MTNVYIYVTGQDGETYEVRPTDGLLNFLERLAEEEDEGLGEEAQSQYLYRDNALYSQA